VLQHTVRADASTLVAAASYEGYGAPMLSVGEVLCVEPSSEAREYVCVSAVSMRGSRLVGMQFEPALTFDHLDGTTIRKVCAAQGRCVRLRACARARAASGPSDQRFK
jgi:hypothetical protein